MTNDKQVEVCWDEYTSQFDLFGNEWHDKGLDEIFKAGFEAAKRSMQPIELPIAEDMYDAGGTWLGRFWADGYVHNAITAAGYSYRVK